MEPGYNEGPRDWKKLSAITRYRCMEVPLHPFYFCWGEQHRSLYRGLIEVR